MKETALQDFRNNLGRYLGKVRRGEEILISERGKIFARNLGGQPLRVKFRVQKTGVPGSDPPTQRSFGGYGFQDSVPASCP